MSEIYLKYLDADKMRGKSERNAFNGASIREARARAVVILIGVAKVNI